MKFYITIEGKSRLKKSFLSLKSYSIISIEQIFEDYGYSYDTLDEYAKFIVNSKINELINNSMRSKKLKGIIYTNPYLSDETLYNVMEKAKDYEKIDDIVLLEDYNVPKLTKYYNHFSEIIYFPLLKKARLIESSTLSK